jgi:hypothetical protein
VNILHIGKHGPHDNADEDAITFALKQLGHNVSCIDEGQAKNLATSHLDFALFHKWADFEGIEALECNKVFWYFDLVEREDTDPKWQRRAAVRINWMEKVIPLVDLGFCTDGDWVKKDTSGKLIWLCQGCDERVMGFGEPTFDQIDILFTGDPVNGIKRLDHITQLQVHYGERFKVIGRQGEQRYHGRELANLYASAKVVIAPDSPASDLYWSNRVFNTLGLGGFLIHPYCDRLTEMYEPGDELIYYTCRKGLIELINYYLKRPEQRERLRFNGIAKTAKAHTYRHRCEQLIKTVQERLA